jgi:hypothetical protein
MSISFTPTEGSPQNALINQDNKGTTSAHNSGKTNPWDAGDSRDCSRGKIHSDQQEISMAETNDVNSIAMHTTAKAAKLGKAASAKQGLRPNGNASRQTVNTASSDTESTNPISDRNTHVDTFMKQQVDHVKANLRQFQDSIAGTGLARLVLAEVL